MSDESGTVQYMWGAALYAKLKEAGVPVLRDGIWDRIAE